MPQLFQLIHCQRFIYVCIYGVVLKYPFPATATVMQGKSACMCLFMKNVLQSWIISTTECAALFLAVQFSLAAVHADIIWADTFITCWKFTLLHLLQRQGFRAASVNPVDQRIYTAVISHHGNGLFWQSHVFIRCTFVSRAVGRSWHLCQSELLCNHPAGFIP